jgi:hypothetical protein
MTARLIAPPARRARISNTPHASLTPSCPETRPPQIWRVRGWRALWRGPDRRVSSPAREASQARRPTPVPRLSGRRLDQSAAATGRRVSAGREPGASRTPRHGTPALHGRGAHASGGEWKGARPGRALRARDSRNARHDPALVPPADRGEVRRLADPALPGETSDGERRDGAAVDDGPPEPILDRASFLSQRAALSGAKWLHPRSHSARTCSSPPSAAAT